MTATNHAITGAAIALLVKRPELAIPLAFLSHFVLDSLPHYNPKGVTAQKFVSYETSWSKKLANPSFVIFFALDMLLLSIFIVSLPFIITSVSASTVFFSMLAAISPDFIGGRVLIYQILGIKRKNPNKISSFTRFHIWLQWMERPWGIWIELVWFIAMILVIKNLL